MKKGILFEHCQVLVGGAHMAKIKACERLRRVRRGGTNLALNWLRPHDSLVPVSLLLLLEADEQARDGVSGHVQVLPAPVILDSSSVRDGYSRVGLLRVRVCVQSAALRWDQ